MNPRFCIVTLGLLALSLACAGPKDDEAQDSPAPEVDDSASSSDDSAADDSTVSTDDTHYGGEQFEAGAPEFTVQFNGSTWDTAVGYWLGGDTSYLNASGGDSSTSQTVLVEIAGNIRYAGTYPVSMIRFAEGPAQGEVSANYQVVSPVDLNLVVRGYADEVLLFGELEGSTTLTDTVAGGAAEWSEMVLSSWPKF